MTIHPPHAPWPSPYGLRWLAARACQLGCGLGLLCLVHGHHAAGAPLDADAPTVAVARKYAPSREIDITHQTLEVTPDFDRRSATGAVRIEFTPIAKPLAELRLDAVDLAITNVESSAPILGWQNTGAQLIVAFQRGVKAGEASWVKIGYAVTEPRKGLYFRTPAMGYPDGDTHLWTQGEMHEARHWFPSYDYPNEKFTTEMICHVPDGMVALSNGKLLSQEKDSRTGLVAWHWRQDKPHVNYLITLCAGYFKKLEDQHGELSLAFWTPASRIAFATNLFSGTRAMLAFFEQETGVKYPWARYDQVVVDDFVMGGMENTAQTTLPDTTLYPAELHETRNEEILIAHELAHQWFGNLVTAKDWSHIWLNEGFATYYAALFQEHQHGRDEFLYRMYKNARRVLGEASDTIPMVYRGYENPREQFNHRGYEKGGWILHMLRSQLGPELYRQCIKTLLERHAYGNVTTEDLVRIIEERSGRSWDQFFDQYVYHANHPALTIAYSWDERAKLARVSIQQTQKLGPTILLFKLPLKIRFKSGTNVTDAIASVSQASEDFYFPVPAKPEIVRVDPEFSWLANVEFPLPAEMLYAQLADTNDMVGQIHAIRQLEKRTDKVAVEQLRVVLDSDPFWGVRAEAAGALKGIHTLDARAALLASTHQPNARVRRAVVQGLAGFYQSDTPEILARLMEAEPNLDVRAAAIRGLAAYPTDQVKEMLSRQLDSTSYRQALAGAAIETIAEQGSPEFVETLLSTLRRREKELTTVDFAIGLRTLAGLAADRDNQDKDPIRQFLAGYVNHPREAVQYLSLFALGRLGDPRAIPVLEPFAKATKPGGRREAAESAIRTIRERKPQAAEMDTLRKEVLELQKQNREIKAELDDLKKRFETASRLGEVKPPPPTKPEGTVRRGRK